MKIQIKHHFDSSILFEHECEKNTIKKTVEKAVLEKKSLSNSNLSGSNLRGSDLRGSNLSNSDLRGSNLRGSDLRGSVMPIFSKWSAGIIDNKTIKIGCKEKTIEDWDLFFVSIEEFETKRGTAEFKQIEAMYLAHKAYLTHLNN